MRVVDISGQRFGRLTVIERFGHNGKRITWLCKCDCGNEKIVIGEDLKNGSTKSCGCLFKEGNNRKHGLCSSRLYNSYRAMKDRCLHASHPGYKNYGGRGIKVCDEWLNSFDKFKEWALNNGYR